MALSSVSDAAVNFLDAPALAPVPDASVNFLGVPAFAPVPDALVSFPDVSGFGFLFQAGFASRSVFPADGSTRSASFAALSGYLAAPAVLSLTESPTASLHAIERLSHPRFLSIPNIPVNFPGVQTLPSPLVLL